MMQEYLEVLMSVERGILARLDSKDIVDSVSTSIYLRRHLRC